MPDVGVPARTRLRAGPATVVDQVVSSASNFVVAALVARASDPRGLALFAGALAVWYFLLGIERALVVEPMVLDAHRPGPLPGWSAALRGARWCAAGGAAAVGVLALSPAEPEVVVTAAALAVAAPLLLLQDVTRWRFLARRDGVGALRSDVVLAGVETAAALALLVSGHLTPATGLLAMALGAGLAVAHDAGRTGLRLRLRARRDDHLTHARLSGWLVVDFLGTWVTGQAVVLLLVVVLTTADAGVFRAVFDLFGPLRVLQMSLVAVLLPAGAAAFAAAASTGLHRALLRPGLAATALAGIYCGGAVAGGSALVTAVYGAAFAVERTLVLLLAASALLGTVQIVLVAGLKAAREARRLAVVRLWTTPLGVLMLLALAARWGLDGAGAALVLGAATRSVALAVALVRARSHPRAAEGAT